MERQDIARLCHQVNKAYSAALGETSPPDWEDIPWQYRYVRTMVDYNLDRPLSAESSHTHDCWLKEKVEAGWTWGPEKDPDTKRHPYILPFKDLPNAQQVRYQLLCSVIRLVSPLLTRE